MKLTSKLTQMICLEEIIEIPVEDDTVEQSLIANDVELNDIPVEQESSVLTQTSMYRL